MICELNLFSPPAFFSPESSRAAPIQISEEKYKNIEYLHLVIDPQNVTFTITRPEEINLLSQEQSQVLFLNGGYFEEDGSPSGLLISKGETISPLSLNPVLSGIFIIKHGKASIISTKDYIPDKDINFALQAGPKIIEPEGKDGIRGSDFTKAERTILAIDKRGKVHLIIIKTPVDLLECQNLLKKCIKSIYAALNLDGGPSSFFLFKNQGRLSSFGTPSHLPYLIKVTPK